MTVSEYCDTCRHEELNICHSCAAPSMNGVAIAPPSNFEPIKYEATEMVEHPSHYGGADNPYEAIKVIEAWEADFNIGTTLRYLCRAGKKTIGGDSEAMRLEDLKKARWYLDREISNLEK